MDSKQPTKKRRLTDGDVMDIHELLPTNQGEVPTAVTKPEKVPVTSKPSPTSVTTVEPADLSRLELSLDTTFFKTQSAVKLYNMKNKTSFDLNVQVGDGTDVGVVIQWVNRGEGGRCSLVLKIPTNTPVATGLTELDKLCTHALETAQETFEKKNKPFKKGGKGVCSGRLLKEGAPREDGGFWDPSLKLNVQFQKDTGKLYNTDIKVVEGDTTRDIQEDELDSLQRMVVLRAIFGIKVYIQSTDAWGFSRYLRKLEVSPPPALGGVGFR